jgi:hypothetical protein
LSASDPVFDDNFGVRFKNTSSPENWSDLFIGAAIDHSRKCFAHMRARLSKLSYLEKLWMRFLAILLIPWAG